MEEYLVVSAICILQNCSRVSNLLEVLWELRADQVILPYISSNLLQVSVPALIFLGLLCINVSRGIVCLNEGIAMMMSKKIVDAVQDTSLSTKVGYIGITAEELIEGTNGLALNETNAMNFIKNDMLLSFLTYFKGSNIDNSLSLIIVKFIWTLAIHSTLKEQLIANVEIVEEIKQLAGTMPAAKYALLKIKGWNVNQGK